MYTIETKIVDINPKEIEQKLHELGATEKFAGKSTSIFFTHNIEKDTRCLRLSADNGTHTLTFKGKIDKEELQEFMYHSIRVSDIEKSKLLLEALGFCPDLLLHKKRKTFMLNEVKIDIDKYEGSLDHVPYLVEIKAKNKDALDLVLSKLGFDKTRCCEWDLAKIDTYYSKE